MTTPDASQGPEQPITEQDVTGLAQKLEQWSETLPEGERALLSLLMMRAQQPEEDTQGYYSSSLLAATNTRAWLNSYIIQSRPTWAAGVTAYFIKDSGPSWVNSPRASFGGLGQQIIR